MTRKTTYYIKWFFFIFIVFISLLSCTKEDETIYKKEDFCLESPKNNAIDINTKFQLRWKRLSIETMGLPYSNTSLIWIPIYEVYLWKKNEDTLTHYEVTSDPFIWIDSLNFFTTYQWKVISGVTKKIIYESDIWEFTTKDKTYNGSIELNTQEEINIFGANNYGRIEYDLSIGFSKNDPIVDFTPLSSIKSIQGTLSIKIDNLEKIEGFNNLTNIGKDLFIGYNDSLKEIKGFNNLTNIGRDFSIYWNSKLITIQNFIKLESIGGSLKIEENPILSSFQGFNNISTIGNSCSIGWNRKLVTFQGFNKLSSIGDDLSIASNYDLTSFKGFSNLSYVGDDFRIRSTNLTIIDGFNNLSTVNNRLDIDSNDQLITIDGFNNISTVNGFEISDNSKLTTINGFYNLTCVEHHLSIVCNYRLSDFCFLQNLMLVNGLQENYWVSSNLVNPTILEIKLLDCD